MDAAPGERRREPVEEALAEIARALSHDARAPLRAIDSFARFLVEDLGGPLPERARQDLERLVAASGRLQRQIEMLVTSAREALGRRERGRTIGSEGENCRKAVDTEPRSR